MSVGRITAIAFVLSTAALAAQSPSRIALKTKVTDPTGSVIQGATIQARTSESRIVSEAETDAQGEATLYLAPDTSTISVRAAGFAHWQYKIDINKDADKPLIAVLRIESDYGPTMVNADPAPETEPPPPIAAVISLEPLESLVDLPSHRLRRGLHGLRP